MSEDRLQQDCYVWFHNTYPEYRGLLFHVPNGGNRNAREGAKFKAMGVIAGVSDFIFIFEGKILCIELKVLGGSQSLKQKYWERIVREEGAEYSIVWNLEEFKTYINNVISNRNE